MIPRPYRCDRNKIATENHLPHPEAGILASPTYSPLCLKLKDNHIYAPRNKWLPSIEKIRHTWKNLMRQTYFTYVNHAPLFMDHPANCFVQMSIAGN